MSRKQLDNMTQEEFEMRCTILNMEAEQYLQSLKQEIADCIIRGKNVQIQSEVHCVRYPSYLDYWW